MNYNDELSKARAELAAVQERLAKLEAQAKEEAAKPWEPKGGRYYLHADGTVDFGFIGVESFRIAGSEYPTREAAESALGRVLI